MVGNLRTRHQDRTRTHPRKHILGNRHWNTIQRTMPQKIAPRWNRDSVGDDHWLDEAADYLYIESATLKMMLCRESREVESAG